MSPNLLKQASAWVARLGDESATDADRAECDAWLAAAPEHREAFRHVSDAVGGIERLGDQLRRRIRASASRPRRQAFAPAAMAAAALLAIGLFVGVRALSPPSYATALGQQRTVALRDGSQVVLNTDTRIVVRFDDNARRIELKRGEAVFSVAHDSGRPFTVTAPGGSVRAIGTQFVVRVEDDRLSVLVIEGVVAVDAAQTTATETAARIAPALTAGRRLDVSDRGRTIAEVPAEEIERSLSWRGGWLEFNGQELGYAAEEVARYSNMRFIIEDPEIRTRPVLAYLRANDLDAFLESLQLNDPTLAVTRRNNTIHITRRPGAAPVPAMRRESSGLGAPNTDASTAPRR